MIHYQIKQSITPRDTESIKIYLRSIRKFKVLTPEEECDLALKVQQGDQQAKEDLIKANLRFVVSIAKQYLGKGIEFEDLIAVGNCGLMKAVEKFDPTLGYRFLTYAGWWIRDYIINEIINNGNLIRIPFNKTISLNKLHKVVEAFEMTNGHSPTEAELAEILQLSIESVENLIDASNVNISRDLEECQVGYTEELNCGYSAILPFLKQALSKMEYIVLTKSLGLDGEELDLKDIAKKYNLTRERVRQIKNKAIIKLRKHPSIHNLLNMV